MKWESVREQYPDQWVVFEAIKAHSEEDRRFVDDLAVIDRFTNGRDAMNRHFESHKTNPAREYYFFHTSREELDISQLLRPSLTLRGRSL